MKRNENPNAYNKGPANGGGNNNNNYNKKGRNDDNSPNSFEDELMMMDTVEYIEGAENTPDVQESRWLRPASNIDPATQTLEFQWMDIDMTTGNPLSMNPSGGAIVGSTEGPVPVIRLYGSTREGQSVLAHIHGFTPYFYVLLPQSIDISDESLIKIKNTLDQRMRDKARGEERKLTCCVLGVERVPAMQSLLGYHFGTVRDFVKIYFAMPSLLPSAKRMFDEGFNISYSTGTSSIIRGQTFESNVPFVLRFMIDKQISGSDWIQVPAATYAIRSPSSHNKHSSSNSNNSTNNSSSSSENGVSEEGRISRCTIEIDVYYNHILAQACVGVYSAIAPLRILSFDIECQGRKGVFPDAQFDPVIQIANTITLQGSDQPIIRNVFTLNTCLPIVGAHVIPCTTEEELLLKWREFVCAADPDVMTGYNIGNFDIPYLLNRAKALEKKHAALKLFPDFGRIRGLKSIMRDTTFQSSAYGKRENIETTVNGRVIFDVLPYMYRNHKLSSYSLNSVSAEFLGQQKEDVHHSIISDLQLGSDADRRRLAVYCLKDAYLPQQLMNKLAIMVNYIEMARVTGVPLNFLLTRGQQIKVYSMLLRKCRKENLLIPSVARSGGGEDENSYEGATVIDPKKAYYQVPIATLDFASLYPSIMQAYNLCYSTLVSNEDLTKLNAETDYEKSPTGHYFIKNSVKKGILPQILDELLAARKKAKKDMNAATDPMEKAVQNGRQLALKISANSVYGFTGATVGQLPCVPIASSVTAYGRNLLLKTRDFVESTYTVLNGYPHNAEVIYGDTDSVMVNFGYSTVEEAMPMATKAAEQVSAIFPSPIKLEFEKVYYPYLLMNKKRYAGLLWTNPTSYDKMDCKGLETVRRDNCLLVRTLVDTCLRKILIDRDVNGAIEYAKNIISDLLQNKMDISMLVITKSLGKSADDEDYTNKQAHVELAMRMRKRDAGSAPNVGDRVAYVIIQAAKGAPAYEKSEDPVYVLDHNLPIDTEYYLTNQLSNPLTRIFEPIIPNPQTLLTGDHTRTVCKPTPSAKAGGIMMFAVKKDKCMGCKTLISDKDKVQGSPLCINCFSKESEIYLNKLNDVNHHQQVFSDLWTECQRCQGSFHQEVICSNKDCPIFYKRKKVQIDLQAAQDAIEKFSW